MRALLLAGGLGTRLRPLTYTRPKHLLPIANRPHIQHVFDLLAAHGIDSVVLLTSYLADAFEAVIRSARDRSLDVQVTHEKHPLGTAGALRHARALVGDETFLAFNADVLTGVDLAAVVDFHRVSGAEATIVLTPVDDPSAYGVVPTEDDGRVLGFIEKPRPGEAPTNLINAGVYVLEPSVLDRIPDGEVWSAERQLFPQLVQEGAPLFATDTDAYWMDIGTPEKYLQANLDALEGRFITSAVADPGPGAVVSGDGVRIAESARVSSACLGAGAVVEQGARVERSVLLPGVVIEHDARISGSILGEGVRVAPTATIAGETIADHRT